MSVLNETTEGCTLYAFWYTRDNGTRDWRIDADRELVEHWRSCKRASYKIGPIIEYAPAPAPKRRKR